MNASLAGTTPPSLRRRLLQLISLATLATWLIAGSLSYRQARHDVGEMMDAHMAQTASLLLAQAARTAHGIGELPDLISSLRGLGKHDKRLGMEFLIRGREGTVLARSSHAPSTEATQGIGFDNMRINDRGWRSLVLKTADENLSIQMLQSQSLRNEEALELAVKTLTPLVIMLPLLLGLIYWSIRRGLKPLNTLADEVSRRSPENLQAIDLAHTPVEALPLVMALNRLLDRLEQSLDNERRFTADAAHELRTPLAAIRVQAQVALASTDPEMHRHALDQVAVGTQRATRLVEQLLRLARLDPLARLTDNTPVDLDAVAQATLADILATTPGRIDDVQFTAPEQPLLVPGDAQLLGIALRNLIENALRYTPPGAHITVFATLDQGEPVLGVRDTGPGVPAAELPKLIQRFYRGKDNLSNEGSGLGLAIVRRISELHGAHLEVNNADGGGFIAWLRWDGNRGFAEHWPTPAQTRLTSTRQS